MPELRARSRSSSNRYGNSTVYNVEGAEQCLDSDQDEDEEEVNLEVKNFAFKISSFSI